MFDVAMENLKRVFMDFYNLTKFKIVLYDSERNYIYSYPESMCDFCNVVRTNDLLAKKCLMCDNTGFDICDKTKKPYIYRCHMLVTEAIAPIYSNDVHLGYLMFGQILEEEVGEIRKKTHEVNDMYGTEITDAMIEEMRLVDKEYISSAVNMMTMCANYLYTNEIIRSIPNMLFYQIKEYIEAHIDGDISIKSICDRFYISRTKLYKIFSDNTGMGMSDYIRSRRIKHAKRLIRSTENSILSIASSVGIDDVNYFIRVFKKYEGITPLQYRKICSKNPL